MYLGGLGVASVSGTLAQGTLIETTTIDKDSLDPFPTYSFYCDPELLNTNISYRSIEESLNPNSTNPNRLFLLTPAAEDETLSYGCETLDFEPKPVC
jgi:hypothetical protein